MDVHPTPSCDVFQRARSSLSKHHGIGWTGMWETRAGRVGSRHAGFESQSFTEQKSIAAGFAFRSSVEIGPAWDQ
jgi:hypothetical protein